MEILDIVDENGEPTGNTIDRDIAHSEGIRHRTSHVWLLKRKAVGYDILLQKRSQCKDSYPGCYDISSAGHIPAGCGYTESAIRELGEELGITASEDELILCGRRRLHYDDYFHGKRFVDNQVTNVYILFTDLNISDMKLQESEVEEVVWMDIDECIRSVRDDLIQHCIYMEELNMIKNKLQDLN